MRPLGALFAGGHVRSPLEDWPPSLWPNHRPAGMGTVAAFSFQSFDRGGNLIGKAAFTQIEFAMDSPLEEAVTSELVSEKLQFPARWENTGKFIDSDLGDPNFSAKARAGSKSYRRISLRSGTGK